MNRLLKTKKFLLSFLAISSLPFKEGKLDLEKDQEQKVIDALGEKDFKTMVKAINKEANEVLQSKENKQLIADARAEFLASLKESGYTEEEIKEIAQEEGATAEDGKEGKDGKAKTPEADASLEGLIKDFKSYQKKTDAMISKLISDPEPDAVHQLKPNQDMNGVEHSATHLFGDQSSLNAFANRPWNQRAAGQTQVATNWDYETSAGKVNIEKLNGDIELFYRENPQTVESLHRDMIELPSFWRRRLNVVDRVSDGRIMSDEVTQVRKLPWLPKNKQLIQPETREIFDVSIDLEWSGHKLSEIERSWLNSLYNREGSSPYKMTFVQFLITELMKKAKVEDRISSIKGVFVQTPDDATVPGRAINRQNGLLHQLYKGIYVDKKVKVPSLGLPTPENIVDYTQMVVEKNIKEESKEATNLVYYMPKDHERWYKTRYRQLRGVETDYKREDRLTIENYENIRIEPLHDLNGTNIHFITFDDNIEVLENIPNEKGLIRFEYLKRQIFALGDYKMGCGFIHLGTKVADSDPDAFKVQTVWTNGVFPFKQDFFIPAFDDKSGELKFNYANLAIQSGFETEITEVNLTNIKPGQVLRVKGNTSGVAGTAVIKNNARFDLASDFALNQAKTLTLLVKDDMTLKEVKRGDTLSTDEELFTFSNDTIDVTNGLTQSFNGSVTTLAGIENGVEQQKLTIGNSGSANLTVAAVPGNINIATSAVIKPQDELVLVFTDGEWVEYSRDIAA